MNDVVVVLFLLCTLTGWVFEQPSANLSLPSEEYGYLKEFRPIPEEIVVRHT